MPAEALKRLYAARALGAKDEALILPLGRALTHLARFEEAQTELLKAVALMPDSLEAIANLAGLYEAVGNPPEAAKALRAFVTRHPELETGVSPAVVSDVERLMFCFLQAGDEEMALKMAERLTQLTPTRPDGFAISGKLLLARHEPKAALPKLEKAIQLAPHEAALLYTYGVALSQSGRDEEALKQWQKTVALNPNAMDAYYRIAEAYEKQKDSGHAAIAWQQIALHNNANIDAIHATALAFEKAGQKSAAAYWRSIEARSRKDFPTALREARLAIADPTWRKRGLGSLAETYRAMHRINDYLDTVRQMTSGGTAEDDLVMATAYGQADKLQEEKKWLLNALAKKPQAPAYIHLLLSQLALRKGLRDEAEAELEQAVALEPKNPTYHRELGSLYFDRRNKEDRLKRAIREFDQLTLLSPGEAMGYQRLGIAYAAANDLQKAAHSLEHAVDLQPGEGSTYQELGRVYARLGDASSSERMFELYKKYLSYDLQRQALITRSQSARNDPAAQIALGDFLARAGDYPAAARYYRIAGALDPKNTEIRAKLQQIYTMLGQASAPAN